MASLHLIAYQLLQYLRHSLFQRLNFVMPTTVVVNVGGSINFRNCSNAPHTSTADHGRAFDSKNIAKGRFMAMSTNQSSIACTVSDGDRTEREQDLIGAGPSASCSHGLQGDAGEEPLPLSRDQHRAHLVQ